LESTAAQFALSHACFLITYPLARWIGAASLPAAAATLTAIAVGGSFAALLIRRRAIRQSQNWEQPAVPEAATGRGQ
jgi:hypothetical protein